MKTITINKYEELENITEEQAKATTFKTIKIKDFEGYFIHTQGYYGIVFLIYKNNRLVYIDEQLHYNHIKSNKELFTTMIKKANRELFTNKELMEDITDYTDYTQKINFLNNYFQKTCESVSIYDSITEEQEKSWYLAPFISFCYYKNITDYEKLKTMYEHLKTQHKQRLVTNSKYFRDAISYELYNHEVIYGGYEQYCNALDTLGLNTKTLTQQQNKIVNEEYNKLLQKVGC